MRKKSHESPADVLAGPRCNYIQTLRRRIRELRSFIEHCRSGEVSGKEFEEIRLRVQSLAGSGAIYGYDGVSESAALLSRALNELENVSLKKDATLAQHLLKACDHALALEEETARRKASVSLAFRDVVMESADAPPVLLTVDDDPAIHDLVQALFEGDARVLTAYNGEEALEVARREKPDLILMDHHMPGTEGLHVMEHLQADASTAAVPVMMLTADSKPGHLQRAAAAGAADFITKPFNPQEFAEKIYGFLHRFHMTVLIASDDDRAFGNRLRRQGIEVIATSDIRAVLDLARQHMPELIFLDKDASGPAAKDLLCGLHEDHHTRHIPVLYLSLNGSGQKILVNLNTGTGEESTIPFIPEKLTSHILTALGLESRWA
ncbi:MAG: response regulator [Alphaproteobacteria bacterium]|nr:response regulator [Alphaproteobacteria bacterium]